MKFITAFLLLNVISFFTLHVWAQVEPPIPPRPSEGEYILDELDWLTSEQESRMNSTIQRLHTDGVADIGVVTLNDCGTDKLAFRKSLFDSWGIGHTSNNNGLLILVCWYDGDASRRSVEQLYGSGLRGILSPKQTEQVAQMHFVPSFQKERPGDGLVGMVIRYNVLLRSSKASDNLFTRLIHYFKGLEDWLQIVLIFSGVMGIISIIQKFFPSMLLSNRERYPYEREIDNTERDFDRERSDGGNGSSTKF